MSKVQRATAETEIAVELKSDGSERCIITDFPFLTHMLDAMACHGGFPLVIAAKGDVEVDPHHLVEDCGYVLGRLFRKHFDYTAIARCGFFCFPMDDALARVCVDLSGRSFCTWDVNPEERQVSGIDSAVFREFFAGFSRGAGASIHAELLRGTDAHHSVEAVFKAFGRALAEAVKKSKALRTTKGGLDD